MIADLMTKEWLYTICFEIVAALVIVMVFVFFNLYDKYQEKKYKKLLVIKWERLSKEDKEILKHQVMEFSKDHEIIPFKQYQDSLKESEALNDKVKEKEIMEKMNNETKEVAKMMYHILNN